MIKQFKDEKDRYWVNQTPYYFVNGEIKPMTSISYKKDIDLLKKHLNLK